VSEVLGLAVLGFPAWMLLLFAAPSLEKKHWALLALFITLISYRHFF